MKRRFQVPRIVFVLLMGVLTGLILVLLYNQASEKTKPLHKTWEAYAFLLLMVGGYISYLKQQARMISGHAVDEKIRTHRLIECLPQAVLVVDEGQRVLAANAARNE